METALNAPPVIDIIGPPSGSNYNLGDAVTFMGWSWDIENGDLTDTMTWTSDRDGALGVGGQISTSTLSAGMHTITASATDGAGATSTQLIVVNIVGPPVGPTTVEVRVANSTDDAEESATGVVSLTSADLELVADATNQTVGLRFTGVAVPQWATILNAWIPVPRRCVGLVVDVFDDPRPGRRQPDDLYRRDIERLVAPTNDRLRRLVPVRVDERRRRIRPANTQPHCHRSRSRPAQRMGER